MKDYLFPTIAHLAALGLAEIGNVRGEFACNSSSSHSIIAIPADADWTDLNDNGENGNSGFLLTTSTDKVRYMAALLDGQFETRHIAEMLRADMAEWDRYDYIEHRQFGFKSVDRFDDVQTEFLLALVNAIARSQRMVFHGACESDSEYKEYDHVDTRDVGFFLLSQYVVRKDVAADGSSWWVLFSRQDGTKLRIRLDGPDFVDDVLNVVDEEDRTGRITGGYLPTKAASPELVDVKVTDRCPYELDCGFCYMGSTRKGDEGDALEVQALLSSLSELGTFEIAFGGGEPTLWPPMKETMRLCRNLGMVPNFTTKNFGVFRQDPEMVELAGSIACSVNDSRSLDRLRKEMNNPASVGQHKITIQIIPEIVSTEFLIDVLDYCVDEHIRVTLLGYKETGRGGEFDGRIQRPKEFWIQLLASRPELRAAIDTTLAEACQPELEAAGVPSWCYHTKEGKFSLYFDSVTKRVGPSSYCADEDMTEVDLTSPDLTSILQTSFETY